MKLWVRLALLTYFLFFASVARAQMSEGERKAAARAAFAEGVDLQDKGRPAEALARFEAAQKLFDAPTHLLHIAQCQALTGKLVEASETYEMLVRKQLPPGSPEAFVQAQQQGRSELAKLRPRIPTVRVTLRPEPQSLRDLQITMNDRAMPTELVGIARPVNPGSYTLSATATGWATRTPIVVEVTEAEQKDVVLTLEQGAGPVTAAPRVAPANVPPPYEPPKDDTKPKPTTSGPSSSGFLLGLRAGLLVPSGSVEKETHFRNWASAGGGVAGDLIYRFAKLFLIGGTLELASLGDPDATALPQDTARAEVTTRSVYWGILAGIMPNVDKITFVADVGLGRRTITQRTLRAVQVPPAVQGAPLESQESYGGIEIALNAGVSFPAGPIRIVPKAGFAFGQFTDRNCSGAPTRGCVSANPLVNEATHTIFHLGIGVYYHIDLAKKPAAPKAAAAAD